MISAWKNFAVVHGRVFVVAKSIFDIAVEFESLL